LSRILKPEVKARALSLWLNGLTYRLINEKTGVSLGAMNELVNEAKRKEPSLDELRELNVMLKKSDSSVVDAIRGAKTLNRVNELLVSLDGLESFIKLSERISSERGVEAERFIEASVRIMGLEAKTGKSYEEVVKDFEERTKRVKDLVVRAKSVQEENRKLGETKAQLEDEIREAGETLYSTRKELNKVVGTQERLKKIGLEKVADLARFINEFESLRLSVEEVEQIAELKKELDAEGIRIGTLRQYFKSTRALKQKCQAIQREMESEETKLKLLTRMRRETERHIRDLQRIQRVLDSRMVSFPCAFCGATTLKEIRNFEIQQALTQGAPLLVACSRCGQPNYYNPIPALLNLALQVLS
jgi:chromosome segregation ATPase